MKFSYTVPNETNIRDFLSEKKYSKGLIRSLFLIENGVVINGVPYHGEYFIHEGDIIEVNLPKEDCAINSSPYPVEILFENEYFLVVNKPKDLSVMRVMAHSDDHLTGRVKYYLEQTGQDTGIHLVNRLDFETRGIVLFAKHQYIHYLFSLTKFEKLYTAHVKGRVEGESYIEAPIERVDGDPKKREVRPDGKYSKTGYKTLESGEDFSLLQFKLYTGRTHQIRVHMSFIGHPLMGDWLYGCDEGEYDLTAYHLSFVFPLDGKTYTIELPNKE